MESLIRDTLRDIEKEENVRILYACEGGSRGYGLEHKDSDYDVRFLYIRPEQDYLSLDKPRDVIERPIYNLDINGWDIMKALRLMRKANPRVFEWLFSSVVYVESAFVKDLRDFAQDEIVRSPLRLHFKKIAQGNYKHFLDNGSLKKYLATLRPLIMALYIEQRKKTPNSADFASVLVDVELPKDVREQINYLIRRRKDGHNDIDEPSLELNDWLVEHMSFLPAQSLGFSDEQERINIYSESLLQMFLAENKQPIVVEFGIVREQME